MKKPLKFCNNDLYKMNYSKAMERLLDYNLFSGMKLSLENSLHLNALLSNPAKAFPSIHIAGTNGKGSVTRKIASGLQHAGFKVGMYISPHISCFRERISINNQMISEKDTAEGLERIFKIVDENQIQCTFFEIATLLCFDYFAKSNVDFAVIETGLGGRFDATNIVKSCLAVITSISLDHTDVLGKTIESIAYEKAGIIKPSIPVILGPRLPRQIFEAIAKQNSSPCYFVHGTLNDFVEENNETARTALVQLSVPSSAIHEGLKTSLPCRLEIIRNKVPVVLDVAHNPDGLKELFKALEKKFPGQPKRLILGLSKNKDIPSCLNFLKDKGSCFYLAEASNGRGAPPLLLKENLLSLGVATERIKIYSSINESIQIAINEAHQNNEIVVICGTFFIMSAARAALGIKEPVDSIDMNERPSPAKSR